jgi:hypothetical protein
VHGLFLLQQASVSHDCPSGAEWQIFAWMRNLNFPGLFGMLEVMMRTFDTNFIPTVQRQQISFRLLVSTRMQAQRGRAMRMVDKKPSSQLQ